MVDESFLYRESMTFGACETETVGEILFKTVPEGFSFVFRDDAEVVVVGFEFLVGFWDFGARSSPADLSVAIAPTAATASSSAAFIETTATASASTALSRC